MGFSNVGKYRIRHIRLAVKISNEKRSLRSDECLQRLRIEGFFMERIPYFGNVVRVEIPSPSDFEFRAFKGGHGF